MKDKILVLAADFSSEKPSLALKRNRDLIAARNWQANELFTQRSIWEKLKSILDETSVQIESVDLFAVGTGPGSYSGLRISIMAIAGMAMPDRKPIYGITAGDALACAAHRQGNRGQAVVIGDARRGFLWAAVFDLSKETGPSLILDYNLIKPEKLTDLAPKNSIFISPDAEKIYESIKPFLEGKVNAKLQYGAPQAEVIADIALSRFLSGIPSGSYYNLRPIYINRAVFVEQKVFINKNHVLEKFNRP